MTTAPARSMDQRFEALAEGNYRRSMRCHRKRLWKRDGRAGAIADLLDLLENTPDWCANWKVYDALFALPYVGTSRIAQVMRRVGINPVKTMGGVTPRQRGELAKLLRLWAADVSECPQCGGPKSRDSKRCAKCVAGDYREATAVTYTCSLCGGAKSWDAVMCWQCRYGRPHPGCL